jgi:hypothetical protein
MRVESHGGMILPGETEELREKPLPVPLCPPQFPHGLNFNVSKIHKFVSSKL